jgi:hypothetical protein
MNFSSNSFVSVVTCTALSGLSVTAASSAHSGQNSVTSTTSATNSETQQSTITITRNSLTGASLLLKIEAAANSQIKGVVKVNGQVVASLPTARSINLTNCLHKSTCEIDITGTYRPDTVIKTEIYTTNNALHSTLQSSGSGMLHQKMVLNIT